VPVLPAPAPPPAAPPAATPPGAARPRAALSGSVLVELRAALEAGAAPGAALAAAATDGPLGRCAQAVRLGQPIAEVAEDVDTGDPTADLLVRALGLAERVGAGGLSAVDQALWAAGQEARLESLLRVRTTQARLTARIVLLVPVAAWLLLVGLDASALRFYTTGLGVVTALLAVLLMLLARVWSRRVVSAARRAADAADPLAPRPGERDALRAVVLAAPVAVIGALGAGLLPGLVLGALAAAVGLRRRPAEVEGARTAGAVAGAAAAPAAAAPAAAPAAAAAPAPAAGAGGAAEAVELVAMALDAGLPPAGAVALAADLAPPAARPVLHRAASRLRAGMPPDEAFAGSGLAGLGDVLAVTGRWGAPAGPALRRLATDLRDHRRAAAEEAAERTEVALVFPTTLLTLPAFVLAVVPPMLWLAVTGLTWSA
jgi:Flp pilus assembly protein TadB